MSLERWDALSSWHNAWLRAGPEERERLRAELVERQPDLAAEALDLAAASERLSGFLETPAFVMAAPELAAEAPRLAPDSLVGPYRVGELLGQGGMADVYRARDVRLGRSVAIKLLAASTDPQRSERFDQEARALAALDHPNVVRVFDVGVFEGAPYLVVELLEGETLRARIARGPLEPAHAVRVASEVASGLAAAHAAGVVHRDLKPENIFLTRSGPAKILDFGIAKLAHDPAGSGPPSTLTGVLVGTAGYVAPEQVLGSSVDARADLFALGVVGFEMLAGRHPFAREHTVDTLHAILHDAPPDLASLQPALPPALVAVVSRLLEKELSARFQSAADLRWALEHLVRGTAAPTAAARAAAKPPSRAARALRFGLAIVAAIVVIALGERWIRSGALAPAAGGPPIRAIWALPPGVALESAPALSPDGRWLAFAGVEATGSRLFLRRLDQLEAAAVAGSEGARLPFWSPDSRSVGFFARRKLMKVALGSDTPVAIADAPDGRGGTWAASGTIVFAPDLIESGLSRVRADGGPVEPLTLLDTARGENSHRWPVFLPDGVHFLYFVRSTDDERRGVYVGRADRPPAPPGEPLFRTESSVTVAPLGDGVALLSVSGGRIEARRFDTRGLVLAGDPQTTGFPAGSGTPYQPAMLSASPELLAFATSAVPFGGRLCRAERGGADARCTGQPQVQGWPRLSPDGRRLARQRVDPVRGNPDIWVEDLDRSTDVRVTTNPGYDVCPVWSPEGRRLAFVTGSRAKPKLAIAAADGSGVIEELSCPAAPCTPNDWSPDGRTLAVHVGTNQGDVWLVPTAAGARARPLLAEPFPEHDARFSPDGRWLVYVSEESGRPEVSVRALEGPPRRLVVSAGGGAQPVWRRDGREILYVDPDGRLRAVPARLGTDGALVLGTPTVPRVPLIGAGHFGTQYDVSPDGRRVYFLESNPEPPPPELHLVHRWAALLR